MKKPIDISKYALIEVIIHSFKHDTNGNPIAHSIVNAYKAGNDNPSVCLYETKRRRQVSYAGTPQAYAVAALRMADIDPDTVLMEHYSGSRSEDTVYVKYSVVAPSEFKV